MIRLVAGLAGRRHRLENGCGLINHQGFESLHYRNAVLLVPRNKNNHRWTFDVKKVHWGIGPLVRCGPVTARKRVRFPYAPFICSWRNG